MSVEKVRLRHALPREIPEILELYREQGGGLVSTTRPMDEWRAAQAGFTFFAVDDLDAGQICGAAVVFNRSAIEATDDHRWELGSTLVVPAARGKRIQQLLVWYRIVHVAVMDDEDPSRRFFAVIDKNNIPSITTFDRCDFHPVTSRRDELAGKPVPPTHDVYGDAPTAVRAAASELCDIQTSGKFEWTSGSGEDRKLQITIDTGLRHMWSAVEDLAR